MRIAPPEKPKGYGDIHSSEPRVPSDSDSVWDSDNSDNYAEVVTRDKSHSHSGSDNASQVVTVTDSAGEYEWGSLGISDTRIPLPLDRLPKGIAAFIRAVSESLQVPPDLVFLPGLAVLAGATRGRFRVQPRPNDPKWVEPLALFTAVFMDPGERKSATLDRVAQPLRDIETELIEQARISVQESEESHIRLSDRVKLTRNKCVKDPGSIDLQAEYDEAKSELHNFVPAVSPRIVVDDITPERLAAIMGEQGGSVTQLSDEGGFLKNLAGRYNEGRANLDLVNKGYSGGSVIVDRIGRESIVIKRAHLAVGLLVQPDVLREMAKNSEMAGRGFLDRFLFAQPVSTVGGREIDTAPVPENVSDYWHAGVRSLVSASSELLNAGDCRTLALSSDGYALYKSWWNVKESRLGTEGDLASLQGWVSKYEGMVLRIAALFTLFENPQAEHVETAHMEAALSLWDYLLGQVQFVFGNPVTGSRAKVLAAIKDLGQPEFTLRDIHRKVQNQAWVKGDSANKIKAELTHLQAAGYVKHQLKQGTRTDKWEAHPDLI